MQIDNGLQRSKLIHVLASPEAALLWRLSTTLFLALIAMLIYIGTDSLSSLRDLTKEVRALVVEVRVGGTVLVDHGRRLNDLERWRNGHQVPRSPDPRYP